MSSSVPNAVTAKRSYEKMPEELEHRLLQALMANIRAHGNKRYDEVREHADFARWIGREAGETGRKRFRRLIDRIVKPQLPDTTKPHSSREINEEQHAWASEQLAAAGRTATSTLPISASQIAAGGMPALRGWAALEQRLDSASLDIDRLRAAALVADPNAPGGFAAAIPSILAKAVALQLDAIEATLKFYGSYHAIASDGVVLREFFRFLGELLEDQPQKLTEAMRGYRRIIQQHGGAPAGGE